MFRYRYKYNLFKIFCYYLLVSLSPTGNQAIAQTVSKHISKTVAVEKDCNILITGKKADIKISGWDKDSVRAEIIISFSHKDKETAKREIKYSNCNIKKTLSALIINNNFLIPADVDNISSLINITYTIKLPYKSTVILNNSYGNCSVNRLNGYLNLHNDYGNINLNNTSGVIRIFSTLSKINVHYLSGKAEFDTKNSEYVLNNINGIISIKNSVGNIEAEPGTKLRKLTINSAGGEVNLKIHDVNKYDYDLQTKYAKVIVNEPNQSKFEQQAQNRLTHIAGNNPMIQVSTKFNNINIMQE
jgi:hypothetical protein